MVNKLNGKKGHGVIIAALVAAYLFAIAGLVTGLIFGLQKKERQQQSEIARYLLVDAAQGLNSSLSAMRLCVEDEAASELGKTALVFAVRAETALECENGVWDDCMCKEAFLNDVATVLHTKTPLEAARKSHLMYAVSTRFLQHVRDGAEFEYNGEIMNDSPTEEQSYEPSETEIQAAKKLLEERLGAKDISMIGAYGGAIEFDVNIGGKNGYAVTRGDRISEFSVEHSGGEGEPIEESTAQQLAIECAESCGYTGLEVLDVRINNGFALVRLCKSVGGAAFCDEYASVAIVKDIPVAFSAGKSDCEHTPPKPVVDELTARRSAPDAEGEGRLVCRTVNGKERICYEYRYDLEDGAHYVYVCAQSGKQMQVK